MEEFGKLAGAIGGFTKAHPQVLPAALAGGGFLSNWLQNRQRQQLFNEYEGMVSNPAELSAHISALEQPLSQALTQSVGNQAQAFLAQRGLAESPNIMAAVVSQALAPYEQQNQQLAANEYLNVLGLPASVLGRPSDLSPILEMLMPLARGTPSTAAPTPSTAPFISDSLSPDFLSAMGVNG